MKKVFFSLILGWFILSLAGCSAPPLPTAPVARAEVVQSEKTRIPSPNVPAEDLAELVSGNTAFALDLYRLLSADAAENLFYSPHSVSIALAMTYAGARGETERQMASALHFTLPQERLHPAFNALDQYFTGLGEAAPEDEESTPFRLHLANALWGQQGFEFLGEFLDVLAQNYGAGLRLVDFKANPEGARQTINQWVSEQTEQKIQDLIPPGTIDPLTRLVLTNAIYFNAAWQHPFQKEATSEQPFTLLSGEQVKVPMMKLSESLLYAEGEGYQLVSLPYHGAPLEMVVILPAEGQFEALQANFTPAWLSQALEARQYRTVNLSFPKFQFEATFSLADALKRLGMPIAFQPDQADFSGMNGERDLYIGEVVHKAYINVDEAGTEAAAATGVIMEVTAIQPEPPVTMIVDRPFLFLIRDAQYGALLFIGQVVQP
ncbi:MAG: serpin family protein [Anaerolineales bacterium]|nr:serpin family protein [Anaerolineales bacterium]MDW8447481.1 serpin family protein [Anaerolineales bacterium]